MGDNSTTLSLYFDEDRTYCLLVRDEAKGYALDFINATKKPLSIADGQDSYGYAEGSAQLRELLSELDVTPDRITVSLPMESVFVHQFPAPLTLDEDEVRKLVQFEISQHFPDQKLEHFNSRAYPLAPKLDQTRMMLAVIMDRKISDAVNELLGEIGVVDRIEVGQLAAHDAFLYNYPESADRSALIIGVQRRYLDISVIKDGQAAYLHTLHYNTDDELVESCESEIKNILEDYVPYLDGAYVFGPFLTADILSSLQSRLSVPVQRFNALRMLSSALDAREREYCGRITHILAPAVGCGLPRADTEIAV